MLSLLHWLIDRVLSPFGRRRAFDAQVVDQPVRHYDAVTAGMVAILNGQNPQNPRTVAGDTTYVSAESIGDDAAVIRLTMLFAKIQGLGESGQFETYPVEKRRTLREDLIDAMSDVRAAALRRRRAL